MVGELGIVQDRAMRELRFGEIELVSQHIHQVEDRLRHVRRVLPISGPGQDDVRLSVSSGNCHSIGDPRDHKQ
jgi:hypothetical protein